MPLAETETPGRPEVAYVPALDALRAVAVVAVIVYHFSPTTLPAGFLGVDVFFVVSGFLIARLVAREIGDSGTVSFGRFWSRRVRRLLPALGTLIVVVLIAAALAFSAGEIHDLRAQALGALLYSANWVTIFEKGSYFASIGRPSPFLHMWTLAVEEQFYVLLPIALWLGRRWVVRHPLRTAAIALLGAVASTVWMAVLYTPMTDPTRVYVGSDTHAMGLLIGVALGVLAGAGAPWAALSDRLTAGPFARRAASAAAAISCVAILLTMVLANDNTVALYRGGFFAFSVLCAVVVVVVSVAPGDPVVRALRAPALVAIGLRSYSLYLWHWPVLVFVTPRPGLDGAALFLVRAVLAVLLAEVSYRLIERPFRFGLVVQRTGSRAAVGYFAALALVAAVLVASVAAPRPLPPTSLAEVVTKTRAIAATRDAGRSSALPRLHVAVFGDSTALVFGIGGVYHADALGLLVGGDAQLGCGLVQTDHVSSGRIVSNPAHCAGWQERWSLVLASDRHARIALMAGAWDILDHRTASGIVRFGDAAWTELVSTSLRFALTTLTGDGRTVYLFEVPCYGAGNANTPMPERSDPLRIAALNHIYADVAASMPRVKVVHWRALVCPNGHRVESIDHVRLWLSDDQHLSNLGAVEVWKWWLPQLRRA